MRSYQNLPIHMKAKIVTLLCGLIAKTLGKMARSWLKDNYIQTTSVKSDTRSKIFKFRARIRSHERMCWKTAIWRRRCFRHIMTDRILPFCSSQLSFLIKSKINQFCTLEDGQFVIFYIKWIGNTKKYAILKWKKETETVKWKCWFLLCPRFCWFLLGGKS